MKIKEKKIERKIRIHQTIRKFNKEENKRGKREYIYIVENKKSIFTQWFINNVTYNIQM